MSVIVKEEPLTVKKYFKNIWDSIYSVTKGMLITFRYVHSEKPVTIEYPEVREILPDSSRSRLFNDVDNCITCLQCSNACPVDCIYIAGVRRDKEAPKMKTTSGHAIRIDLTQYVIDTSLCCYCGLCTEACPTKCLTHTTDYEYSQYEPDGLIYDYLEPEVKAWKDRIVN